MRFGILLIHSIWQVNLVNPRTRIVSMGFDDHATHTLQSYDHDRGCQTDLTRGNGAHGDPITLAVSGMGLSVASNDH
jgi:hypothetical protein